MIKYQYVIIASVVWSFFYSVTNLEVHAQTSAGIQVADTKYRGQKLTDSSVARFDTLLALAPEFIEDIQSISATAEFVLAHDTRSLVGAITQDITKKSHGQGDIGEVSLTIEEELKILLDSFAKFAPMIQKFSTYISPLLNESLEIQKLKKCGVTLKNDQSFLKLYVASTKKPHQFFSELITTRAELLQLASEINIFLKDFVRSMVKARYMYKKLLEQRALLKKAEEVAKKNQANGDKEPMTSV